MSSNTERLGLLKKDPVADGDDTFNIKTMLNDNWDKIDKNVATLGPDGKVPSDQLNLNTTEFENKIADLEAELGNLPELETTTKANIVAAINELKQLLATHSADEAQHNLITSTYRTDKDEQSTFTTVEERRADGTLYCRSILSERNEDGNHTVRTILLYNKSGTEPINTLIYNLVYDDDGDWLGEVLQ